jgi:hypothetical protein
MTDIATNVNRADELQVSLPFLLQQAAWLYERELSQVRAQIRRVGNAALSPTTAPPSTGALTPVLGGYPMNRTTSMLTRALEITSC